MYQRIVVLIGMPRSGTSWLSQIFDSSPLVRFRLSPIFSYDFKNAVNESSSRAEYERVFRGCYESDSEFMDQTQRREADDYPTFPDTRPHPPVLVIKMTRFHNLLGRMLELFADLKMVAIVRHPCGAICSWLKTQGEFPSDADPLSNWDSGACRKTGFGEFWGFSDWVDVTTLHLDLAAKYPERFLVVRYESLVADRDAQTRMLFDCLGLPFGPQTEQFLAASVQRHAENPYAVFKRPSVADAWRTELDPRIRDAILTRVRGTRLEQFAL